MHFKKVVFFILLMLGFQMTLNANTITTNDPETIDKSTETYNKNDPYEYTGVNGYPGYSGFMYDGDGFWDKVWGVKPQNSVNLGLWTAHLSPGSLQSRNWDNQGLMVTYDMFMVGTFINSFWERSYIGGIQRNFYQDQLTEHTKFILGYRLGVIYGYGGSIDKYTPVIPLAQILARVQYRDFGVEFQYSGIIISGSLYFTF